MLPRPAVNPRLIALLGVVAVAALLPLAGASAGPAPHDDAKAPERPPRADAALPRAPASADPARSRASAHPSSRPQDTSPPGSSAYVPPPAETTARCGPEISSPAGVEAQTCVLTQAGETWARTYYRNATGESMKAVLSVMEPTGRTVRMHCAVGAEDEPAACDTPRERTAGAAARYTAVAEFASESDDALLLRSGSNSTAPQSS